MVFVENRHKAANVSVPESFYSAECNFLELFGRSRNVQTCRWDFAWLFPVSCWQAMMGTVKYWFDEWASSASPSKRFSAENGGNPLESCPVVACLTPPGFALLEREISEFPWMSNLAHLSTIPIEANIHRWSTVWKACTRKRTLRSIKAAVEAGKTGLNDGKDWRLESSGVNCGHVRISVPNGQTLSDTDPSVLYFHCSTMGQGKQAPCSSVGNRSRLGYDAGWRCGDDTLDSLDLQYPKLLRDV